MTSIDGMDDELRGRQKNETVPSGGFEWTCPYCGTTRLNKADDEEGMKHAIAALRSHILASDGAEHGPRQEFPSDDMLDFSQHVVEVKRSW